LVYKTHYTVVRLEVFASALKSASLTDYFGLLALVNYMLQMGIHPFVDSTVATVVDTRGLVNVAFASVFKSLVELILNPAVIFVTCDCDPLDLFLLEVAQLLSLKHLIAIWNGALGTLHYVSFSAGTTKAVATVLMCYGVDYD
jgi:hypothetical protein